MYYGAPKNLLLLLINTIVVERPITRPTPHRSGRAELPHPALQLTIHSCKTQDPSTNQQAYFAC